MEEKQRPVPYGLLKNPGGKFLSFLLRKQESSIFERVLDSHWSLPRA